MGDWPFTQPKDSDAYSTKSIVSDGVPILYAYCDEDDHSWQFMGEEPGTDENMATVKMEKIVTLDPTLQEIAHMEPGYYAWREKLGSPWTIERAELSDDP